MNKRATNIIKGVLAVALCLLLGNAIPASARPLKVFILAGQSNMQGHANISTLDSMRDDPRMASLFREMHNADGTLKTCQKVWISSVGCAGDGYADVIEQTGKLTAGFGASPSEIGPEFTFGIYMEKLLKEPILIIKTSWGGRSLHTDFRPPSAGIEPINDFMLDQWKRRKIDAEKETAKIHENGGVFYRHMIAHVKKVLANIKRVVPEYDPKQGYELAGFAWFQGFNDMIDSWVYPNQMKSGGYNDYANVLVQFIRDIRKDLSAPEMPFVIGVMGIGGEWEGRRAPQMYFRQAQAAPASLAEFQGNVVAVHTSLYWDDDLEALQQRAERLNDLVEREFRKSPNISEEEKEAARKKAKEECFTPVELQRMKGISNGGYHYLGAAKIVAPIGKAFADTMFSLLRNRKPK